MVDQSRLNLTVNNVTNARLYAFGGSDRANSTNLKESGDSLVAGDQVSTSISNNLVIVMQRTLKTIGASIDLTIEVIGEPYPWYEQPFIGKDESVQTWAIVGAVAVGVVILICISGCIYGCCTEDESKPKIETYTFDKDEDQSSQNQSQNPLYKVRQNSTEGDSELKAESVGESAVQKYLNDNENSLEGIQLQDFAPTVVAGAATAANRSIVMDDPPSQERKAMSTHQSNA